MRVIFDPYEMYLICEKIRLERRSIGFVPTMGYLHEGHLSLFHIARQRSNVVIASIFVNPAQFGPEEDYERYPRDLKRDMELAESNGCDFVFAPEVNAMYPKGYQTYVEVTGITERLCGGSRPDHFKGVTTIVLKLFNLIKPTAAVFGQKDAQQAFVIQRMVVDLGLDIDIVIAPIIREKDGLAMSSRNVYLKPKERKEAVSLYRSLKLAEDLITAGEKDPSKIHAEILAVLSETETVKVEYIEIVDTQNFQPVEAVITGTLIALAAMVGNTRLIDNTII